MGDKLTEKEGRYLVKIAFQSIEYYFRKGCKIEIKPAEVPGRRLVEDGACFVTLYKDGQLRGCIGSLEASRPLVLDVADNALNAAFGDPRFHPLNPQELNGVKIEISVLTPQKKLDVKLAEDLLGRLVPGRHGITIQKGWARATFLPVVWEQIPDKQEFLAHLCMKAGLQPEEWKDVKDMEFYIYEAQEFSKE